MQILPEQLRYWGQTFYDEEHTPQALQSRLTLTTCYRSAFVIAADDIKQKAVKHFVTILKEGEGADVLTYEVTFFRGSDLAYACSNDAALIKEHLNGRLDSQVQADLLTALRGIGKFLAPQDVVGFVDPLVRTIIRERGELASAARQVLVDEYPNLPSRTSHLVVSRPDAWLYTSQQNGNERAITTINNLKEQMGDIDESDPFAEE